MKRFWFVSTEPDLEKELQYPSIPVSSKSRMPRVQLYETPGDALSLVWLGKKIEGMTVYLYQPLGIQPDHLLKPDLSDAPWTLNIPEYWYTLPVRLKYIKKIKVTRLKETKEYHYGPRSTKAPIYVWSWKEELKPWEMRKRIKLFSDKEQDRPNQNKGLDAVEVGTGAAVGAAGGFGLSKLSRKAADRQLIERTGQKIRIKKITPDGNIHVDGNPNSVRNKVGDAVEATGKRLNKFARSKTGKAVTIGTATLAVGGTVAHKVHKRNKRKEENE